MELMRKQMQGYRVLQSPVQQFEQQTDLIIPDVNPDALAVLGVWGACTVTEQQLRRDRVTAGGVVNFTLLYRPENGGSAMPLQGSLNFQEVLECKDAMEGDLLFLHAELTELRGIILNSRKVGIQCKVALYAWVYQHGDHLLTEGVDSKPEEGIQLHLAHHQVHTLVAALEKTLTVNEEVRIGETAAQAQLLHTELQWKAEDVRMLNKKVMVRGAVQVRVLLMTEAEGLREMEYSLPFSQIAESSEVKPDCNAVLHYTAGQQQIRLERREEGLFLRCGVSAKAMIEVYRERRETTVADLYSTQYYTSVKHEPVPVCGCQSERVSAQLRENVQTETKVAKVLHWHCVGAAAEVRSGKLQGSVCLSVLCEDEQGNRMQQCVTVRDEREGTVFCPGAAKVSVRNLSVTATGGILTVELQLQYCVRLQRAVQGQQVETCELDLSRPRGGYAPGTLLLRTVAANESTWELARDYGTTESAILTANHMLPDQGLEENQLVLIPFLRK